MKTRRKYSVALLCLLALLCVVSPLDGMPTVAYAFDFSSKATQAPEAPQTATEPPAQVGAPAATDPTEPPAAGADGTEQPTVTVAPTDPPVLYGKTNRKGINVRAWSRKDSSVIGTLPISGTPVELLESIQNKQGELWYAIKLDNNDGYVLGELIDLIEEAEYLLLVDPTPSPAPTATTAPTGADAPTPDPNPPIIPAT